ncbi:M20/M25/M40 family metallo-hydrolase [uncultured Ralstonia sp.]|jgi:acetylornithine deacetylase/succinyl-diaminopimelate desuccinylase-like protein|uniref:M20/M25/M40 family metallo-hydrolase n=1 Tax=Ralstonia sp. TaxID=54061 RepID=UPI001EA646C8|nr:M20/M25/M40 family metallo-hydrolase [uncultured Ralstonia sp.]UCF26402.1 MAG: M20/M25/M40 family metallo-hydrolase [Ralstonia sp.]
MKQPGSNSNRPTAIRSIALAALSTVLLATPVHAAAPLDGARLQESADRAAAGSYREWVDLLALPNDATVPADIQKNASWLVNAFTRHGFAARELANGNKPMVYAEYSAPAASGGTPRKTVLFYMHFDGQSVTPSQWAQRSPWEATLKSRAADGKWQTLPIDKLYAGPVDPEWRLFARSSSDDKAPIVMFLAAFDALRAAGVEPAVNIKVILDSEEEKGSPSLGKVIGDNLALLRNDGMVIFDGPMHQSNRPTLIFGNRGVLAVQLKVFGASQGLHSGHYGNYAANPAQRLASLLATMKDDEGRVTIPGYYTPVKLDDQARRIMAAVPDDEAALRKRLGIAKAERVGANYQEAMQYPSLNIRGIASGDVGEKARTIVPEVAIADIDIRTVPETSPEYLFGLLKQHVEKQGYHLVSGEPTAEERARYPKLAALTAGEVSASSSAARTDLNAPVSRWLQHAMQDTYGEAPVQIRMMGGTVPTGAAVQALRAPFVIVPLVNADNNQHSYDENMRLGNYRDGIRTVMGILETPLD